MQIHPRTARGSKSEPSSLKQKIRARALVKIPVGAAHISDPLFGRTTFPPHPVGGVLEHQSQLRQTVTNRVGGGKVAACPGFLPLLADELGEAVQKSRVVLYMLGRRSEDAEHVSGEVVEKSFRGCDVCSVGAA